MTRVLLVNDDGIDAPGLALLERCARAVFDEVFVVAPATEQSGVGMGLTLHDPLRFVARGPGHFLHLDVHLAQKLLPPQPKRLELAPECYGQEAQQNQE